MNYLLILLLGQNDIQDKNTENAYNIAVCYVK